MYINLYYNSNMFLNYTDNSKFNFTIKNFKKWIEKQKLYSGKIINPEILYFLNDIFYSKNGIQPVKKNKTKIDLIDKYIDKYYLKPQIEKFFNYFLTIDEEKAYSKHFYDNIIYCFKIGVNPNFICRDISNTSIFYFCLQHRGSTIPYLLKHDVNFAHIQMNGYSILPTAAANCPENLKYLLKPDINVNECDKEGNNALIWLATNSSMETEHLNILLGHNINIHHKNYIGQNSLVTALLFKRKETTKKLFDIGLRLKNDDTMKFRISSEMIDFYNTIVSTKDCTEIIRNISLEKQKKDRKIL